MFTCMPLQVETEAQLALFCGIPSLPVLEPERVVRQGAEGRWLLERGGEAVARCSLWWEKVPAYPGERLGVIGHYGACDLEAGRQILALACEELKSRGCTLAVGPMDGNTWQQYRLVTKRGRMPPFFLEPDHPEDWPNHFTGSGFNSLARYFSALNPHLAPEDPRLVRVAERAGRRGITIRPVALDRFEAELARLYRVALASFGQNLLYTPLAEAEFVALYTPLRPYIRPELVLVAEREGRPLGFLFALPDWLEAQRGQPVETIIIKTVAVRPEGHGTGLGDLLVAQVQGVAYALGYRRAIHALMYEKNPSRRISARYGTEVIREYGLFGRKLSET